MDPEKTEISQTRPPNLEVGNRLAARYQITREVHSSQYASTLLAEDEQTGGTVVVKAVTLTALTAGVRTRIEHEASTRYLVKSESLVPIDDFGVADGLLYVVMPFVSGVSLADRLRRGPLSVSESLVCSQALICRTPRPPPRRSTAPRYQAGDNNHQRR